MRRIYHYPHYTGFKKTNPNVIYRRYSLNKPTEFHMQDRDSHIHNFSHHDNPVTELKDYGPEPFVINIERATKQNNTFRTALWTGKYMQLTLMSIGVGEDIGLEIHPNVDQFIRIEEGTGLVKMGDSKHNLNYQKDVSDGYIIIIPAGKWHNIINTGNRPLKLYSIYAPPQHPRGTVHETKEIAEAAEKNN
ncbi:cupin 2 barrel domain-containing protein [Thermoclostridium stercorarium subsp. stercorarium DSM 8532]|jgi:mannose-6-phosphate isomerase-like protein (cupin superfamily)|uniref:Cupin 2 barrel domain-containing protein n=3 Tax=Thermoclostridium stercorarium TaxID=1510 RepID=L7VKZ4_THES1|nr:cupin domain-containing protein [Thermoclostridium stercorarium]AGC68820.1 cupin 2 barrel domain-containing protein [Thermoclostridium stercorarium subsp. stercorarium DSM 8532]AGI39820.1 mannose-6-phosphate isomerase [Thermoclostridium stercorarium subsp. stercorarium DSM 8532]ANW99129.1 cupin [Thermoclostridium stercorarium subsp. thermolacticum DSM 2910]ANX01693.1 cupin [Thermoclostridium stercorarium subsp. leptospartum DSM 9219]UZQ84814.1 cupin domain-containing protein [Thermoclostrid